MGLELYNFEENFEENVKSEIKCHICDTGAIRVNHGWLPLLKQRRKLHKCTDIGPRNILLKPKIYFSNNILLFGNFAATPLLFSPMLFVV